MENKNSNFLNFLPDLHNNQDNLLNLFYSATRLPWIRNHDAEAVGRGVHLAQIIMWQLE